jgi:hypothetical protein
MDPKRNAVNLLFHSILANLHIMKKTSLFLLSFLSFLVAAHAQPKPVLLPAPTDWQLEQFSLPPIFAPTVPYKGMEELRFSPDMFKKDAPNYFTYIFAARFDNTRSVSLTDISSYLLTYFKGLCSKTAADRKLSPVDTNAITVAIAPKRSAGTARIYSITLHAFGVFTDGAPVTLNMEVKVLQDPAVARVYLLFIVSPQPKTAPVWEQLYDLQKRFVVPAG